MTSTAMTIILATAALVAAGGGASLLLKCGAKKTPARPVDPTQASSWQVGPIIGGKNYSKNLPLTPIQTPDGFMVDLTSPAEAHYVTYKHGPLTGASKITMRFRIEADEGVVLFPPSAPQGPASVTLYFQQKDDDWATDGKRWWATATSISPLLGDHFYTIEANLDAGWTSVEKMTQVANPKEFLKAIANAESLGFTFGGGTGYGHGTSATGKARIVVVEFAVS